MPKSVPRDRHTLSVQDHSHLPTFLRSAQKVWEQKHPGQGGKKGGRPNKKDMIQSACQIAWDRHKKTKPSLGQLIQETRAALETNGNQPSRNTVRMYVLEWLHHSVAFDELPKEMFRRNAEVRKLATMNQALFDKKDLFRKAWEAIAQASPRPFANKKYPPKN